MVDRTVEIAKEIDALVKAGKKGRGLLVALSVKYPSMKQPEFKRAFDIAINDPLAAVALGDEQFAVHTTVILLKDGEQRFEVAMEPSDVADILAIFDDCIGFPEVESWIVKMAHSDLAGLDDKPEDGGPTLRVELAHKLLWYGCRRSGMQQLAKRGEVDVRVEVKGDTISNVKVRDHAYVSAKNDLVQMGLVRAIGERAGQTVWAITPWEDMTPEQRRMRMKMENSSIAGDDADR